jgi:hypothetical protein
MVIRSAFKLDVVWSMNTQQIGGRLVTLQHHKLTKAKVSTLLFQWTLRAGGCVEHRALIHSTSGMVGAVGGADGAEHVLAKL